MEGTIFILLSTCNARKEGNLSGPLTEAQRAIIFLDAGTGGGASCRKGGAGLKVELLSGEEVG